jgi:hypothetical protein
MASTSLNNGDLTEGSDKEWDFDWPPKENTLASQLFFLTDEPNSKLPPPNVIEIEREAPPVARAVVQPLPEPDDADSITPDPEPASSRPAALRIVDENAEPAALSRLTSITPVPAAVDVLPSVHEEVQEAPALLPATLAPVADEDDEPAAVATSQARTRIDRDAASEPIVYEGAQEAPASLPATLAPVADEDDEPAAVVTSRARTRIDRDAAREAARDWALPAAVVILAGIAILEGILILRTPQPAGDSSGSRQVVADREAVPAPVAPTTGVVDSVRAKDGKHRAADSSSKRNAVRSREATNRQSPAAAKQSQAPVTRDVEKPAPPVAPEPRPGVEAGWIAMRSSVELDVFEDGTLVGTTRSPRLMLSEGTHVLEWVNETLGYRDSQSFTIAAGKVTTFTVPLPTGIVQVNAVPWAEVWIDGKRVGETPIGDLSIAIGSHEVIFRHPELGEKTVSAVVKTGAPTMITTDLRSR